MKTTCEVIKDLMPSYIDNLLSEDSRELVEGHLVNCESCKKHYETLKEEIDLSTGEDETETRLEELRPLKKIKKKMNRRTLIVSLLSVICAGALVFGGYILLFHYEMYTPYEDAGIKVTANGKLFIEEDFYGTAGWNYDDHDAYFFCVSDTFVTKRTERTQEEIYTVYQDFAASQGTHISDKDGVQVKTPIYYKAVYYPPKEYVEKISDRDFIVSMSAEEEYRFIEEMKAASVLLWERPDKIKEERNLEVRFTAKVESLVKDKNAGENVPRYAVVKLFQGPPMLIDTGTEIAKELEIGETYSFKMKSERVELLTETYDLDAVISLYHLQVEAVSEPTEEQISLEPVEIWYHHI